MYVYSGYLLPVRGLLRLKSEQKDGTSEQKIQEQQCVEVLLFWGDSKHPVGSLLFLKNSICQGTPS